MGNIFLPKGLQCRRFVFLDTQVGCGTRALRLSLDIARAGRSGLRVVWWKTLFFCALFMISRWSVCSLGFSVGVFCRGVAVLRNLLYMSMSMVLLEELVLGE